MRQTVDARRICIYARADGLRRIRNHVIFCVRLLHGLLVLRRLAIPGPQGVERAASVALTLLFYNN